jgi:LCP family protein required for cell wall assembly
VGASAPVSPPPGGGRPALVGRPRRRRWRKVLLVIALTLLLVAGLGAGGGYLYLRSLDDNIERVDVFSQIEGERPAATSGALNILMLGSDSRDPDNAAVSAENERNPTEGGDYRADTIILMHIPADRQQGYLISLPRDLWVSIPDNGEAKLNAATAFGGIPLMVRTVEGYSGVRINHVMLIDFGGFVEVTDALGGVDMYIEETVTSIHGNRRTFEQGNQHLNGEEALDYIRQRQFADGDFTRIRNQQQFLRALMDKAASSGTLTNPGKLNAFLQTATKTLTVDEEFSLTSVAWDFRHLRSNNLTFLTSPNAGTGTIGDQSVVLSDDEAAAALYGAIQSDQISQWITDNPDRLSD